MANEHDIGELCMSSTLERDALQMSDRLSSRGDHIEYPIAVINALQKQIEHLEAALRRQNDSNRNSFELDMRRFLLVLRAHAIIPLYLGKQSRSKALEPSSLIDGSPHRHPMTVLAEVLRDHLWLLDDAPIPNEMKEALRESCHYGCNRWELQTSELAQQV